ncbi:type II secretion system protein N [Chitinivorax sp. B]|uniref:type II secretion system protein N n=1 Tax=Chitinivorax sp. B TaxID=2502235 RepID=UPI0010F697C0|nr:type II secretion system protein N [Chitinivorax sp. B]
MRHTQIPLKLLNVLLIALIAWLAASVTWRFVAPKPTAVPGAKSTAVPMPQNPVPILDLNLVAGLFGRTQGVADNGQIVPSNLPYKLRGVITGTANQVPAATFSGVGAKEVAVTVGDEIQPGVKLLEVASDHVVVQNNGRRERIDLDAKPALVIDGVTPVGAMQDGIPPGMGPNETPPGAEGNAMVLTVPRAALVNALQSGNVAEWATGLRPDPAGGIRITGGSAQALISALELRDGDVLRRINGAQLSRPGDIALVYNEFTQKNKVQLEVMRDGRPTMLDYTLQP